MDFITAHAADLTQLGTAIVTIASIIANFTKTDADNTVVAFLGKIVNFFALNFKTGK